MRCALVLLFVAGFLAAEPAKEDVGRKDLERMQGDWAGASVVIDGFPLADEDAQARFRTVKGDQYTVFRFDKAVGKGTMKLDATKTPKAIDAVPAAAAAGKAAPMPLLGIYEIEGDTLKMCFAAAGKERPKTFESKEGSGQTLTVWTREKK